MRAMALMAVREVAKQVYAKYFHGMACSIHYSEEGRRGQDNIQCWEDEVGKKTSC